MNELHNGKGDDFTFKFETENDVDVSEDAVVDEAKAEHAGVSEPGEDVDFVDDEEEGTEER